MWVLRVNETKLTLRNAFILDHFALGGEKKSKYDERTLLMVESCELWTLNLLWTSQIWTLIYLINNFVIVLLCAKCSKLITLEENIISVQQLPLCLPLFFVFSSETLNSGIKAVLMELFFKMQFVKNVLVCVFGVFTFSVFCYCFYEGFIPKIILVSWFYFLFVSVICSKSLDLTLESSVIHFQCPY